MPAVFLSCLHSVHIMDQLHPPAAPTDQVSVDLSQPFKGGMLSGALQHYEIVTEQATALRSFATKDHADCFLSDCPVCSPLGQGEYINRDSCGQPYS